MVSIITIYTDSTYNTVLDCHFFAMEKISNKGFSAILFVIGVLITHFRPQSEGWHHGISALVIGQVILYN